jgi:hypothetical protein
MRAKYARRPSVEPFEDRCVPASVRAVAGNLLITNPVGPLTVQTLSPGVINVADAAKSVTVGGIGSLIAITGTNAANVVRFRADAAAFPGNVLVNTLNGNDTVDLSGNVGGNVTVLTGLGNDTLTSASATVRVGGNLTIADTAGKNTWTLNGRDYAVGRDLTYYGVGTLSMGGGNTLKVGGFASLTAIQPAGSLAATFDGEAVTVGKLLNIRGGSLTDSVQISSKLSVVGSLFVTLAGGANRFNLLPAAGGTGVNGTLFYTGGGGSDDVLFGANAAVGGDTNLDLGNGANTFADNAATDYAGALTLRGGNTSNTLTVGGVVAGALTVSLGNGTNATTVTSVPAGQLRYRGGNGADALTLRGVGLYAVDLIFGTGTNALDIDQAGLMMTGTVTGTGGDNTFTQGAGELVETIFLIDFP